MKTEESDCKKDEDISDTKKFCCEHCKKTYSTRSGLWVHVNSVHEGVKHTCTICGFKLKTRSNLCGHMKNKHKEIILETRKKAKPKVLRDTSKKQGKLFTKEDTVKLIAKHRSLLKENRRQTKNDLQEMAMKTKKKPKQINTFLDNLRYGKYKRANLPALDNDEDLTERSEEPEKGKKKRVDEDPDQFEIKNIDFPKLGEENGEFSDFEPTLSTKQDNLKTNRYKNANQRN